MSGGHFDYVQHRIADAADEIERIVKDNNVKNEWGYSYDYNPLTLKRLQEAAEIIKKAGDILHRVDWLIEDDDSEDTFNEWWDKNEL